MSALFIITVVLLAAIAYTIYRKQQQQAGIHYELPPPRPRGLFGDSRADETRPAALPAADEHAVAVEKAALLARAAEGDFGALADARRLRGGSYYAATLAELLKWAESSDERLHALAGFVVTGEHGRGSVGLSQAYTRLWEQSPDRAATARALHLAALGDDAMEFGRVVEAAARLWREGRLTGMSAGELRSLAESEFWVMGAEARASGAAFVVKQMIASLRSELPTRAPATDEI